MADFFREEAVYIFISLFILGIAIFVTTRPFMPKKSKIAIPVTFVILSAALLIHYKIRTENMKEVTQAFKNGKTILCMDKTNKISNQVVISKKAGWILKEETFFHKDFPRGYNIRQCIPEE